MNDQNPYDQSLHDKLSRLPVPDVEKTWPQMRMLLDEEMPEGGRSKRRGGWWFFSAILMFIIAGSWTLLTFNFSKQNVDPPLSATENTSPKDVAGNKTGADKDIVSEKPGAADDKTLLSKKLINKEEGSVNNQNGELPLLTKTITGESSEERIKSIKDATIDSAAGTSYKSSASKNVKAKNAGNDVISKGSQTRINYFPVGRNDKVNADKVGKPVSIFKNPGRLEAPTAANQQGINKVDQQPVLKGGDEATGKVAEAAVAPGIERMNAASFAETIDSINNDYGSYISYAPVSRKYYRQNKKYGKPVNIRQPYTTVGRNFAIGLSLPLAFPLGDQKPLGYNVNAGPNTASDYIPAPHAQYHFNAKAYIQSELQLMSPQFIKPALLYQNSSSNSQYQTTSSVSAQKLYYFNVPVSLHYSPFKHFYMGTGLQFSSLLSGVALHEQIRTGMVPSDSLYQVSYSKFGNDSISGKLNGSEMRLMLDANYYWNKFTVGLRYNQALSNYVSTRATPTSPLTVDKNKSLHFYMRYNLWEDKKRKVTTKTLVVR